MSKDFTIVTSFNGLMYYNHGQEAVRSFAERHDNIRILAYHENSVEYRNGEWGRLIQLIDFVKGVEYFDLFERKPELVSVVDTINAMFEKHKNEWTSRRTIYLNENAANFNRKIFAMRDAVEQYQSDIFCWLDSDVFCKRPFDKRVLDFFLANDICYLDRGGKVTESGVICFNTTNPRVRLFIQSWCELIETGKIFEVSEQWADHNAFDYLRKNDYSDLTYGKLRSGEGRKIWYKKSWWSIDPGCESGKRGNWAKGWLYVFHNKGFSQKRGLRSRTREKMKRHYKGYLLSSLSRKSDEKIAKKCKELRKTDKTPIHVITDVSIKYRSSGWRKISNVSFSHIKDTRRKEILSHLLEYSPFHKLKKVRL